MDGYAVIEQRPGAEIRKVIEEVGARRRPRRCDARRRRARLMTGGSATGRRRPAAVIAFEQTEALTTTRSASSRTTPSRASVLTPAARHSGWPAWCSTPLHLGALIEIGILAEIGHAVVHVQPRPKVAILPTGIEASSLPGTRNRPPGRFRNSNWPDAHRRPSPAERRLPSSSLLRDEQGELERLIATGLEADVLLLCGGVSAGQTRPRLPGAQVALAWTEVFYKIALRPGKPLWFGVKDFGDRQVLVV